MPRISPKLTAAIAPPLTAVVTAAILTETVDRASLAALAGVVIGALLGYHAPPGLPAPLKLEPIQASFGTTSFTTTGGPPVTYQTAGTDNGDDGHDTLPAELADHPVAENPPADEVDLPHGTVTP